MTSPRSPRNNPSRRPDPSVYKRRRIIALAVVAIIVVILWNIVAAIAGFIGGIFGANTPDPLASTGTQVTAGAACAPGTVTLEAVVANASGSPQSSFATGVNPYFGYKITNNSSVDCTFDVGGAVTFFSVTSGDQTIWDSKQCDRTGLTNMPMLLKAGVPTASALSDWYRVYSSETGCGAEQAAVAGGGASYHLTASVNGVISTNSVQFLLN